MARPRVLVTSATVAELVRLSPEEYDVAVLTDHADRDAWLDANGAGITALVCSGMERLDAERLALLPDLQLISVIAAGMAGIDLAEAQRRGIAVTNAGDINAGDVADFAITLLLAHRRDLLASDAWVREGRWVKSRMPLGRSIAAERIGIVGLGHIGRAVAERLQPFGCEIRWWGRSAKPDAGWAREESLTELARWATTLVIAVAGSNDTRELIDRPVLEELGPEGLLVNVARGFVVDEEALKDLLRAGRLGGAALDVVAHEPDDGTGWTDVPRVILAPHVAGSTRDALGAVVAGAADNVRRLFAGEPLLRRVT
jgi:lactate dehydrogenase-like 2-hydroxyacid dehydrogenase